MLKTSAKKERETKSLSSAPKLVPWYELKGTPPKIKVMEMDVKGEVGKVTEQTREQVAELLQIKCWSDNGFYLSKEQATLFDYTKIQLNFAKTHEHQRINFKKISIKQLAQLTNELYQKVALCGSSQEATGWFAVLLPGQQLEKSFWIPYVGVCISASEYQARANQCAHDHCLDVRTVKLFHSFGELGLGSHVIGEEVRNFAPMLNHASAANILAVYSKRVQEKVAAAVFEPKVRVLAESNTVIVGLEALETIKAVDKPVALTWDYGASYWLASRGEPSLLTNYGLAVTPTELGEKTTVTIQGHITFKRAGQKIEQKFVCASNLHCLVELFYEMNKTAPTNDLVYLDFTHPDIGFPIRIGVLNAQQIGDFNQQFFKKFAPSLSSESCAEIGRRNDDCSALSLCYQSGLPVVLEKPVKFMAKLFDDFFNVNGWQSLNTKGAENIWFSSPHIKPEEVDQRLRLMQDKLLSLIKKQHLDPEQVKTSVATNSKTGLLTLMITIPDGLMTKFLQGIADCKNQEKTVGHGNSLCPYFSFWTRSSVEFPKQGSLAMGEAQAVPVDRKLSAVAAPK